MKISKTQNRSLGILFALVVVLLMAVVQGVIYYTGFISYWIPFFSVLGAMYAYYAFNHKIGAAEIAIIVLSVCIITIASIFITLGIIAGGLGKIADMMGSNQELFAAVITDIVVSVLISVVAGVIVGVMFKKRVKQFEADQEYEKQLAETQAKIREANAQSEESNSETTEEKEPEEKADTTTEQGNE